MAHQSAQLESESQAVTHPLVLTDFSAVQEVHVDPILIVLSNDGDNLGQRFAGLWIVSAPRSRCFDVVISHLAPSNTTH